MGGREKGGKTKENCSADYSEANRTVNEIKQNSWMSTTLCHPQVL